MKGRTQETRLGTRLSPEILRILKSRDGFISSLPLIWTLKQTPIEPPSRAARSGMLEILKSISDLKRVPMDHSRNRIDNGMRDQHIFQSVMSKKIFRSRITFWKLPLFKGGRALPPGPVACEFAGRIRPEFAVL